MRLKMMEGRREKGKNERKGWRKVVYRFQRWEGRG